MTQKGILSGEMNKMTTDNYYNDIISRLADRIISDYETKEKLSEYYHIVDYRAKIDELLRMPLPRENAEVDLAKRSGRLQEDEDRLYKEFFTYVRGRVMDKIADDVAYQILKKRKGKQKWE